MPLRYEVAALLLWAKLQKGTLSGSFFGDTSHAEKIFFHFISKKLIFNGKNDVV